MSQKEFNAFISYSHADGEAFAEQLREKIEKDERGKDITFWQDYSEMRSGNWNRQLEKAIEAVEFLIMIITPSALASANCKDEWIHAKKKGICIMPVNGLPEKGDFYKQFPPWLKPEHVYNLDKQWQRFINDLNTKPIIEPVPFMAKRLAEINNYIPRTGEINKLKKLLIDKESNTVSIMISLQGSGGFGKTTLAIELCNDDDIINAFTDGILWVTMGQVSDTKGTFKKLYEALTGEEKSFIDIENAQARLRDAIAKRNCLIVIDDAWERDSLKELVDPLIGKSLLITTQIKDILSAENVKQVVMQQMQTEEAANLLTALFSDKVIDKKLFETFSDKLGKWPLLLKLVGAQINQRIESGQTPEQVLKYITTKYEKKGITAFDLTDSKKRDNSVKLCLDASIDLLSMNEKKLLFRLGIFPEDEPVPFAVIAILWQSDDFDTEEFLTKFTNYTLLDINLSSQTVTVHDILLQYYLEHLSKEEIVQLHSDLIAGFGDFRNFTNQYVFKHYIRHLKAANKQADAFTLLQDYDWLEAKLMATDINELLKDYQLFDELEKEIELIYGTLKVSEYILAEDKNQLALNIIGRLGNFKNQPITEFVEKARKYNKKPWLKPLISSMNPPSLLDKIINLGETSDCPFILWNSKVIYSNWDSNSIYIRDIKSGKVLHKFPELTSTSSHLILYDDHILISGSDDRFVRIWDLADYSSVYSSEFADYISCLIVQNDTIVVGIGDGSIATIDLKNSFKTIIAKKHTDATNVLYAKDTTVTSGSSLSETIATWNLNNPDENYFLTKLHSGIESIAGWNNQLCIFQTNGEIVIAEWDNNELKIINTVQIGTSGSDIIIIYENYLITPSGDDIAVLNLIDYSVQLLNGHTGMVTSLCIKDNYLISGSFDKRIKIWSLDTLSEIKTLSGHSYYISEIVVIDNMIVSLEDNGQLFFWKFDVKNTEENSEYLKGESLEFVCCREFLLYVGNNGVFLLNTLQLISDRINQVTDITSLDSDDRYIYYTTSENDLVCLSLPMKQIIAAKKIPENADIVGIIDNLIFTIHNIVKDKKHLLSAYDKNDLEFIWSDKTDLYVDHVEQVNNKYLIFGQEYGGQLEIRDAKNFQKLKSVKIPNKKDLTIENFTTNTKSVIYCSDTEVYSCDLKTRICKKQDHIHIDKLYGFDANDTHMALGGWVPNHDVKVYEKENLNLVQHFKKHATTIDTIKIIGDKIISSSIDRTIIVWTIQDQQIITRLTLDESINRIDYNAVSKTVIMEGESGRLYIFQACGFSFNV